MIEAKRAILLTKLRIENKKECVKSLNDAISFEKKYLEIKTEDIKNNQQLLNMNFNGLKKQTDKLSEEVKKKEADNIIKTSELNKLKNDILNKENQSKVCDLRQKTLLGYKKFIQDIFLYSGEQANLADLDKLFSKEKVFITEHDPSQNFLSSLPEEQQPKKFVNLLNKIEDDNLMLIRTLQNQKHEIQSLKTNTAQ